MKVVLYTDASFQWQNYHLYNDVVKGMICIVSNDVNNPLKIIEKLEIERVPELKQYNNIYEFMTIAKAIEIANYHKWNDIIVLTDSSVAKHWADKKITTKPYTKAHHFAQQYMIEAKNNYQGRVSIFLIPREYNLAVIELEKRKKNQKYESYS